MPARLRALRRAASRAAGLSLIIAVLLHAGCADTVGPGEGGPPGADARAPQNDRGVADADLFDASQPPRGPDAATLDAAPPDALLPDAALPDAALPDAGSGGARPDAAVADAGAPDGAPCLPTPEACDGDDDDCDGAIDEGAGGGPLGRACFDGAPDVAGVGACRGGRQTCAGGDWGPCEGQILPSPETCNGIDDDCDGRVDTTPEARPLASLCFDGDPNQAAVGQCRAGERACVDGQLGPCVDQVLPGDELCDSVDNDCDGAVDELEGGCVVRGNVNVSIFTRGITLGIEALVSWRTALIPWIYGYSGTVGGPGGFSVRLSVDGGAAWDVTTPWALDGVMEFLAAKNFFFFTMWAVDTIGRFESYFENVVAMAAGGWIISEKMWQLSAKGIQNLIKSKTKGSAIKMSWAPAARRVISTNGEVEHVQPLSITVVLKGKVFFSKIGSLFQFYGFATRRYTYDNVFMRSAEGIAQQYSDDFAQTWRSFGDSLLNTAKTQAGSFQTSWINPLLPESMREFPD